METVLLVNHKGPLPSERRTQLLLVHRELSHCFLGPLFPSQGLAVRSGPSERPALLASRNATHPANRQEPSALATQTGFFGLLGYSSLGLPSRDNLKNWEKERVGADRTKKKSAPGTCHSCS